MQNATTLHRPSTMSQKAFSILTSLCLLLAVFTPDLLAQQAASVANPQPINRAATDNDMPADSEDDTNDQADSRWPMRFTIPQGELTVYQPQLTGFENNQMTGRAAVSIKTPDNEEPVFGAIWLTSRVQTDRAARTVKIIDVKVDRVRIPDIDNIPQDSLGVALTNAFQREPMKLTLDQLIAMVERVNQDAIAVKDLNDVAPKIVFINNPAVLVQFDGQPRFAQSEQPNLLQAVNTPFFLVLDKQIKRYYLKGAGRWYISVAATGPYLALNVVPDYVTQLAKDTGYVDPESDLAQAQVDQKIQTPAIITATEPTELVWTLGPEELSPIEDTNLLYVTNTDSDIILDIDSQKIYLLLSGRWYRSSTRTGPWEYVLPDNLPVDFARIPTASDKGSVLAHVAGTQMAQDALADNYVPQTATIDRTSYEQPPVEYDGEPRFEQVERMRITYAVNTPNAVLRIEGRYYVCYNAVWYRSNFATGPWELCTTVPSEVYLIPPTSPVYAVRYVRIYDVTPTVVYTGYLPGYVGSYVHHGVVVYGTGYHYRPWVGPDRVYYPRPYTWGFTPRYDPYNSYWGFNVGVSVNFGNGLSLWFGSSNRYVASRATWFGYGGYRPTYVHPRHHYDHRFDNNRYDRNNRNYSYRNNNNNDNYRDSRDRYDRQNSPRRADLNLYERRRDVIRTNTPGKAIQDRQARVERIDRTQTKGGLTAHDQRLDRNNNGRVDRNERATTNTQSRDNNVNQSARDDRNNRGNNTGNNDRANNRTNDKTNDNANDSRNNTRSNSTRGNNNDQRADNNKPLPGLTAHDQRLDRNKNGKVDPQERPSASTPTSADGADRQNNTRNRVTTNRNNVYADESGNVYRKSIDGWEHRDSNKWVPGTRANTSADPRSATSTQSSTRTNNNRTRSNQDSATNPNRTIVTNNGRGVTTDRNNSNSSSNSNTNPTPQADTSRRTNWQTSPNSDSRRTPINPRGQSTPATTTDTNTSHSNSRRDSSRNTTNTPAPVQSQPDTSSTRSDSSGNSSRVTTPSRASATPDPRSQRTSPDTSRSSAPSVDRNSDASLNADYRARVRGEQRQRIYNQPTAGPSQPTPAASTRTESRADPRTDSRTQSRSQSAAESEAHPSKNSASARGESSSRTATDDRQGNSKAESSGGSSSDDSGRSSHSRRRGSSNSKNNNGDK